MNDFLSKNDRAILETELALLCSRIQLYYLIRWRVWRNRDICKMDEARRRLMLFSDMRSEFIARLVGSRPYEPYVLQYALQAGTGIGGIYSGQIS